MGRLLSKHREEEWVKIPEIKKFIDDTLDQCVAAIEKERADTLIIGYTPPQAFEKELRQGLDKLGYDEIPIVCSLPASIEMAKTMVNMKLMPAARAYPGDFLRAKPEYR